MRTQIHINAIEDKTSKAGRAYKSIKTDVGTASCFEAKVVNELCKYVGKDVEVEMEEVNNFKNIRKFYNVMNVITENVTNDEPVKKECNKDILMQTSYAKDICIALINNNKDGMAINVLMDYAVKLVKQAKIALEQQDNPFEEEAPQEAQQ